MCRKQHTTEEAIILFNNKEVIDEIIVEPYEQCGVKFNDAVQKLLAIIPELKIVDGLFTEEHQIQKLFLMNLKNFGVMNR